MKMSELMTKYHDDLATIISLEAGKPFNEAKGIIDICTNTSVKILILTILMIITNNYVNILKNM